MVTGVPPLTERPAWKALQRHYEAMRSVHLRRLFADDPRRGERYAAEAAGLYLDYSKHRVTDETLQLLLALAEESGLPARIDAMFRGDKINVTERRAVLHTALRAPRDRSIVVDGEDVVPKVHAVLDRMADFARRVRDGRWTGHTGRPIRNVVNIGIGGSDLGPVMAYASSRRAPCGRSTPSISGGWSSGRRSRSGSCPSWRAPKSPRSGTTPPPTPSSDATGSSGASPEGIDHG
jgi:glucose-6-phosphate isomerase